MKFRALAASTLTLTASLLLGTPSYAALPSVDASGNALPSLAPMLKNVNPAVVNIATYTKREVNNPLLSDPFFRHFFNIPEQRQTQRQRSAGSGVIVDAAKGTVITNHHVINGADEIQVVLHDGRTFAAKLVGSDPEVDIAVLKIEGDNLTQLPMSNSDELQVGDFVVAIGNPFGLGQTVTTGVVSALGRTGLGIEGYEDFIQTDASINPGNSGGALVNLRGELVGINTAIIAPAGGNVGIGFAIPINMARASVEQIMDHGEVKRGQIGVSIQDVTPELQEAFGLKNGQLGVLVTGVADKSEADKAGLKPGDVIIAVDGRPTLSTGALRNAIGVRKIGDTVKITYIRDGREKTVRCKVGNPNESFASVSGKSHPLLEGAQFENHPDGQGVVVSRIAPRSPAAASGLQQGDLIIGANRRKVSNLEDFNSAVGRGKDSILLHIQRGRGTFYLVIR
ncbi:DegQ family serine endoprotease [Saccharophagus sp. K07]|uniref:DegQ family serine endoprotease n=1 Tax=Saccharophagus sp. K07 TaxID=2283636 RepID=UPI00165258AC|nr:DegQ family serine endoprotease [Saccharophagus sp. K07]MBC6904145.1 DegQ family serine endoprotease [Saccharophagus sp. K07]